MLKQEIEHHIEEEERKVFSAARDLFLRAEAKAMAEAFIHLKPQVSDEGIVRTTLDSLATMLPTRMAATLRTYNLHPQ